jgi:2-phosphoglycerate kinase
MIYLIGGAPRTGKTILAQRISARLGIGWISTDLLMESLRVKHQWKESAEERLRELRGQS